MTQPRIIYGVQGEGRGHATRSLTVIQSLCEQGYDVKVLSGGDAAPVLKSAGIDVIEIPLVRYRYAPGGNICTWRTLLHNTPKALGLLFRMGPSFAAVKREILAFRPDLGITDFEPYLSRVAPLVGLPLVAIDHQHFLTETQLPKPHRLGKAFILGLYRLGTAWMGGKPDRIIASSFWHFPRRPGSRALLVGPFLSAHLKRLQPANGSGVVVYLKRAGYFKRLFPAMLAHPEREFQVFSDWTQGQPKEVLPAHIHLQNVDRQKFLSALAASHCLISTAGNQVIGEAAYLGKPILAFPEPDIMEQELNAAALNHSRFGRSLPLESITDRSLTAFLAEVPSFKARLDAFGHSMESYDGQARTLRALKRFLRGRLPMPMDLLKPAGSGLSPALAR